MVVRKIEGIALWDDIYNFVVDGKLIRSRSCDSGCIARYHLPEYGVQATFAVAYHPERRELTKIKGPEESINELEEYLALFATQQSF